MSANVSTERAPSSASNMFPFASMPGRTSGSSPTPTASSLSPNFFAIGYAYVPLSASLYTVST